MSDRAVKTRERILEAARELFNEQGEKAVTTNHIAAHLGISPGNLYYHFRNKTAIIKELLVQYSNEVQAFLTPPEPGQKADVSAKRHYLEAALQAMWHYRFLHRDMQRLAAEEVLRSEYEKLAGFAVQRIITIYRSLIDSGVMVIDERELEALAYNLWLVIVSWVSFVGSGLAAGAGQFSKDTIRRAIYQALLLDKPYVTDEARKDFEALLEEFYVPINQWFMP